MKYYVDGNYIEMHVSEDCYYCTNEEGNGLFFVNSVKNSRDQILGTAQFSVRGVKDKKGKLRSWYKAHEAAYAYSED